MLNSDFYMAAEVAQLLGVTVACLGTWRRSEKPIGPPFIRHDSGAIRYRKTRVHAYIEAMERGEKFNWRNPVKPTKNRPTLKKLKAKIHRVMMKYPLSSADIQIVMRAFSVERLRDLQAARHALFVATLIALGERYAARDADARVAALAAHTTAE